VRSLTVIARGAALTASAVLLIAAPALAHPFVAGGGRVPVQSLATIELDLAHGCGVESAGTGPDTDEVALEVPAWLRVVDVPQPEGWTVTVEHATDGRPDALGVVVWAATTGAEPAPRFALDVVVDGEAGETRYLRVSQRCGDLVERWIGTPDEPAAQPAVRLRLEPADPDRPAPPLPTLTDPARTEGTPPSPPSQYPQVRPGLTPSPAPPTASGTDGTEPRTEPEFWLTRGVWSILAVAAAATAAAAAAVTIGARARARARR